MAWLGRRTKLLVSAIQYRGRSVAMIVIVIIMYFPVVFSALFSSVAGTTLFATSYSGNITSLALSGSADGSYTFEPTSSVVSGTARPGWMTLVDELVFSVSSGDTNGSVEVYQSSSSGELTLVGNQITINGPVHNTLYNRGKAIVTAHYSSSTVQTFSLNKSGDITPLQNFTYSGPLGPQTDRQDAPHPHAAHVDPTDSYVIVPDLGSDLLRIFSIDPQTSLLTQLTPVATGPGRGPRHAVFWTSEQVDYPAKVVRTSKKRPTAKKLEKTFCFVVNELAQSITSYSLTYGTGEGISFTEVGTYGVYGENIIFPGATSAELAISPDNGFLVSSSRGDLSKSVPNFDPGNSTNIISDTLQSWKINQETGGLILQQIAPSGGRGPRHFSMNANGTLVAVSLQYDERVVIAQRDATTGQIGRFVANVDIAGEVVAVIWDESK